MQRIRFNLGITALCLLPLTLLAQTPFQVKTNRSIELFGAIVAIVNGPQIPTLTDSTVINGSKISWQQWYADTYRLYQRFARFDTSTAVRLYTDYANRGFTDDFFAGILLQVNEVPAAKRNAEIDSALILRFGSGNNFREGCASLDRFLSALNNLYVDCEFPVYLAERAGEYKKMLKDLRTASPDPKLITVMERIYGRRYKSYTLVPSLTMLPSTGFGKLHVKRGAVYNVFGPFRVPGNNDPFADRGFADRENIQGLSVHEFSHSFVNPVIDALPAALLNKTDFLYEPLRSKMMSQGYMNWTACLYEHFVRAGEVLIARELHGDAKAAEIVRANEEKGYKYLPFIVSELEKGSRNRNFPATVQQTVRKLADQEKLPE